MYKPLPCIILILSISGCGSISEQLINTEYKGSNSYSESGKYIVSSTDLSKPDLWPVTAWPVQELSTGAEADYLDDLEKDVILHLNMARTNPAQYAHDFIEPRIEFFSGMVYREQGETTLITHEGTPAVDECASDMDETAPMNPLDPSEHISLAAADHAQDLSVTGDTGHIGSDSSDFSARIERYGQWLISIGEIISYGPATGREIVVGLLIDDGVSDRGHRRNILNPNFRLIGIAIEDHPAYGNVCVIEFAADFVITES